MRDGEAGDFGEKKLLAGGDVLRPKKETEEEVFAARTFPHGVHLSVPVGLVVGRDELHFAGGFVGEAYFFVRGVLVRRVFSVLFYFLVFIVEGMLALRFLVQWRLFAEICSALVFVLLFYFPFFIVEGMLALRFLVLWRLFGEFFFVYFSLVLFFFLLFFTAGMLALRFLVQWRLFGEICFAQVFVLLFYFLFFIVEGMLVL